MAANADPDLRPRPTATRSPWPRPGCSPRWPTRRRSATSTPSTACPHARSRRGKEMHPDWFELPIFYFTNPAAVLGPGDPVAARPARPSSTTSWRCACVLGRGGTNLGLDDAEEAVAEFMVMNDWSARDVQRREMALSWARPRQGLRHLARPDAGHHGRVRPRGLQEVPSAVMTIRSAGSSGRGPTWTGCGGASPRCWSTPARRPRAPRRRARVGHLQDRLHPGAVARPRGRQVPPTCSPATRSSWVAGLGVLANRVVAADAPGSSPTPTACARGWASERPRGGVGEPQRVPGRSGPGAAAAGGGRADPGQRRGPARRRPDRPRPGVGGALDRGQVLAHVAEMLPWAQQAELIAAGQQAEWPGQVRPGPGRGHRARPPRGPAAPPRPGRRGRGRGPGPARPARRRRPGPHRPPRTLGDMTVAEIVDRFAVAHLEEHADQLDPLTLQEPGLAGVPTGV